MDPFLSVAIIVAIVVGLPCLLMRPLLVAIADRIAGKKYNSKELAEMKSRMASMEQELRALRVQVIGIESSQEFSNKLLENLRSEREPGDDN
ncbi:MAG: hypothetical protein K2W95_17305 [Candidatus Obscuribacterales bacterium]|nr:hypothetical protein [Candidatus Obscuribacterales bacterium]